MTQAQKPDVVFRRKRTSPFKSAEASVQSTTGSRGLRISGSDAGYTKFRSSVKGTGYPLHSPVSPSLLLPCVAVCHHISTGLYLQSRCLQNTTPYSKTTHYAQNNTLYNCIIFDIPLAQRPGGLPRE
jgi:hypothetical protein